MFYLRGGGVETRCLPQQSKKPPVILFDRWFSFALACKRKCIYLKGNFTMTLNPVEGNQQQPTGGSEQPTSTPSGSQQGQPLPVDVQTLVAQVEELGKQIKGIQKGTDKRFEQVGGNIK